ncbi:MAG TPA: hypothetical protein VI461_01665, partial [Chitinophagaceae bacterium]|nr:hypothetical protein [Chitinophagaceae bacterium]
MKKNTYKLLMTASCLIIPLFYLSAQQISEAKRLLEQPYNLVRQHSKDTQYFEMQSKLQNYAPDGTPQAWDIYHLYLRCVPSGDTSKGDEYTCLKFTVQINKSPEVSI